MLIGVSSDIKTLEYLNSHFGGLTIYALYNMCFTSYVKQKQNIQMA